MTSQHNYQSLHEAPARVLRQDVRDAGLMGSGHTAANPAGAPINLRMGSEKFFRLGIDLNVELETMVAIINEQIDAARERLCQ